MLTPSSNTVLEPMTAAILRDVPSVSAHFSRFRVTQISLSDQALAQFDRTEILRAASLLGDARCTTIAWNGTAAGWLGFEADITLCREIEAATAARACTSVLALNEVLTKTAAKRLALVTPYTPDVQARIIANYAAIGIEVVSDINWNLQDNFSFAEVEEAQIAAGIRQVAQARPDAIAIYCTNLRGAALAADLERETGIPIYDTVATAVWKSLQLAGVAPAQVKGWGRLFDL
jgi:maleate isomerase